jgi:predicted DsbA family dithiol-disulfide isomerase
MTTIEVFGDVCCPFTYAGLVLLRQVRDERDPDTRIVVRAWPLEWINGHPFDPDHIRREIDGLLAVVPDRFAGFSVSAFPTTSVPAFGLVHAAYAHSLTLGEQAAFAVREAVFERGLDVGDPEVLAGLAAELGLPMPSAEAATAAVAADHAAGQAAGVVGSPHFVTDHGSWFCPLLHISQTDGRFTVRIDEAARTEFLANVFGTP